MRIAVMAQAWSVALSANPGSGLGEDIRWGVRNPADPTCAGLPKERISRVIAHVPAPFPVLGRTAT